MDGSRGQKNCRHDGYYSGLGMYSQESETIRYVLVCDDCGSEVREISAESYVPNPLIEAA